MTPHEVKSLREYLRLNQGQFALKLGVSRFTVVRWESSTQAPSALAVAKMKELKK